MNVINTGLSLFLLTFSMLNIVIIKRSNLLEMEAVQAMEVDREDLIDIIEEADMIQAERIIDDFDPREAKDKKKKNDMKRLEETILVMNLDQDEIQHEISNEEFEVNS